MLRQTSVHRIRPAIPLIAYHRVLAIRQMDACLVLSARQQFNLQQGQILRLLEHSIRRMRQSALLGIGHGVHAVRVVLCQIGRDGPRALLAFAVHDGEIRLPRLVPPALQAEHCLCGLREHEDPRGIPVQSMADKDTVPGPGVPLADIFGQSKVGGSRFLSFRPHRQEPGGLIHHQNVPVLVKNREASRQESAGPSGRTLHRVFLLSHLQQPTGPRPPQRPVTANSAAAGNRHAGA
jgi:hypothetical protein